MKFTIEIDRETDGRWIAELTSVPGALAYGDTWGRAVHNVVEVALQVAPTDVDGEAYPRWLAGEGPDPCKPAIVELDLDGGASEEEMHRREARARKYVAALESDSGLLIRVAEELGPVCSTEEAKARIEWAKRERAEMMRPKVPK